MTTLKAKEIADIVMAEFTPRIEAQGFQSYKGKKFIKVNDELLCLVELNPGKSDFYLWYAIYPLCDYKIWLGSASVSGRYPKEDGGVKVTTEDELNAAISGLDSQIQIAFDFFNSRSSIVNLEKNISADAKLFPLLTKGYCLASLGQIEKAKACIKPFLDSGLRGGDAREGSELLMAAFEDGTYKELLEKNKADNIKKLRLKKFISA